jgi:hypothetical protein
MLVDKSCAALSLQTHTIQGLEHNIATDLFAAAAIFAHAHFPSVASLPEDVFKVEIEAIEILGKESWDLLERDEGQERGRKVEIAENRVRFASTRASTRSSRLADTTAARLIQHGSIEISTSRHRASSSKELLALVDRAAAARQTRSTIKNDVSSRSHALTTVLVTNTLFPTATPGRLFIVDLAGSERAADRAGNERDRLEEGRLINESLMTLKNCVRARSMVCVSLALGTADDCSADDDYPPARPAISSGRGTPSCMFLTADPSLRWRSRSVPSHI